ncbi:Fic family protein [Nocardia cyriacigeorgica]|uniref:Fic family protein n=1 Tax=Nocardia cyriacigeorgica TaxID=135487 RepID=A0A5R8PLF7_9NOCA|nr:Fic/DOC family N-terminal domain-containing protein [Nocardia cyriacigeorgica]TLG17845.1 Fic family protein [Nocardia cyriacigeorgica]
MDLVAMKNSPIGKLVPTRGFDRRFNEEFRCSAYLPDPLPDSIDLSTATWSLVVDATAAMARADELAMRLPNPLLLVRQATRTEAVSTSAIEGTYAALTDVLEADFLDVEEMSASVAEVQNYVRAAESAYQWIAEGRPITLSMLADLQAVLVRGTRSDGRDAGSVRDTQVFIGVGRGRVEQARFVPPPPGDLLRDGLIEWEQWIRRPMALPSVVRIALAHYQFESLHPFTDGNGRLGRLVALLQLVVGGDLRFPVLNISPWLEQNRSEYQQGLLDVSLTGDWDAWVAFMCAAVHAEALETAARARALSELRTRFDDRVKGLRRGSAAVLIARDLIGYPMLTAKLAAELHGVSYQAANEGLKKLSQLGLVRMRSARRGERIYACDAVLRVLEA